MFLDVPGPIRYVDPWLSSYLVRFQQLTAQPRRIAYFYEFPDTSTFRYRAFNPGLTLGSQKACGVSAAWFDHRDLAIDDGFVENASALVICRCRYDDRVARLASIARRRGIPLLFDCDDLVFDIDRLHLLIDSLNLDQRDEATWNGWFATVARISATLRLCDKIITTNEFLAARASEFRPDLLTAIMPNYLNPLQQELSERMFRIKKENQWADDGRIHVGYFSGSPSHARDFAVAAPAVARLMKRDPRIVLRIVGFLDLGSEFKDYRHRIEVFPLQDFINLQRLIAEVEINIAPLQENTFTNCKSDLKFFEAAICGTLTLATPTVPFRRSVDHGKTGFLVPAYDWDNALGEAVDLVADKRRYGSLAEDAFQTVRERYGWDRQAHKIVDAVFG